MDLIACMFVYLLNINSVMCHTQNNADVMHIECGFPCIFLVSVSVLMFLAVSMLDCWGIFDDK